MILVSGHQAEVHSFFKVRAFGGVGFAATKSDLVDQLNYQYQNNSLGSTETNTISYGGGLQVLVSIINSKDYGVISIGVDAGYFKAWSFAIKKNGESAQYDVNYMNISGVIEWNPWQIMIFQVGFGYYLDKGKYDTHSDFSPNFEGGNALGFSVTGGIDVPITDYLFVPFLVRMDMIFPPDYTSSTGAPNYASGSQLGGLTVPIRIMLGLTLKL